jgi:hypothetical protein
MLSNKGFVFSNKETVTVAPEHSTNLYGLLHPAGANSLPGIK